MKHAKLVNRLIPIWFLCYAGLSWAASSFAQDVRGYDWESLLWSGAAGLLGGAFRTILTLAGDGRVVLDILKESWKDAIVALIAGLAAYVVIQGVNSTHYFDIPRDLRMLIIVGAGWTRMGFFGRLDRLTTSAVNAVDKKIRGGDEPPPSSAAVPLGKE